MILKIGKYLWIVLLVASSNLFAVSIRESLSNRFSQFSSLRPSAAQVKKLPSLLKNKAKTYKKTTALLMTPVIFYLFKKAVEQDPKFQEAKLRTMMWYFQQEYSDLELAKIDAYGDEPEPSSDFEKIINNGITESDWAYSQSNGELTIGSHGSEEKVIVVEYKKDNYGSLFHPWLEITEVVKKKISSNNELRDQDFTESLQFLRKGTKESLSRKKYAQLAALSIILSDKNMYKTFLESKKDSRFVVLFKPDDGFTGKVGIKEQAYGVVCLNGTDVCQGNNLLGQAFANAHNLIEYYDKKIYNSFKGNFLKIIGGGGFLSVWEKYAGFQLPIPTTRLLYTTFV